MIEDGTLTDENYDRLQEYMDDIQGEADQHAFLLLETETMDGCVDFDDREKPKVQIKKLANTLQIDELFQEYRDNNCHRVQSDFLLCGRHVHRRAAQAWGGIIWRHDPHHAAAD